MAQIITYGTIAPLLELLRQDQLHPDAFDNQQAQTADLRERSRPFGLIGLSHQNSKDKLQQRKF